MAFFGFLQRASVSAPLSRSAKVQHVSLAELLGSLTYALDLTEGQPVDHCVRCCWIGFHIGLELGLPQRALVDLYYTLLLKDLGCSSNAARICQLYLTDDLAFKKQFKRVDGSLPKALHFVLTQTGLKAGLAERFGAILNIFQNGGQIAKDLIDTRCHRGADIARKMRFNETVALGIQSLDEHWDGNGKPYGLKQDEIPVQAQIALLAQVIDVFHVGGGRRDVTRELKLREGKWFSPQLLTAFANAAARAGFWEMLNSPRLRGAVVDLLPQSESVRVDEDYLDDIAAAFAQVIDAKSPYTNGHSERVTLFSDMIAERLGFSAKRRRWLKRAALLHDIGKLGVSNSILDKPDKLNSAEWVDMRQHSALSETILGRVAAFKDLAPIAGAHHERLDGQGYPKGLSGDQIALETRIITTADIFDALTAERPYRAAMSVAAAFAIMADMVDTAIDRRCLEALQRAMVQMDAALVA